MHSDLVPRSSSELRTTGQVRTTRRDSRPCAEEFEVDTLQFNILCNSHALIFTLWGSEWKAEG